MNTLTKGSTSSGAEFSPCLDYRYLLWRRWTQDEHADQVMFIGLNPSTADETEDDPTIRRCIGFAKSWDYSGLLMMNAFAFRATNPKVMMAADAPVGPGNDEALSYQRTQVGMIVAAWGNHCSKERQLEVLRVLNQPVFCLGRNLSGAPKHPLYVKGDTLPKIYWTPEHGFSSSKWDR